MRQPLELRTVDVLHQHLNSVSRTSQNVCSPVGPRRGLGLVGLLVQLVLGRLVVWPLLEQARHRRDLPPPRGVRGVLREQADLRSAGWNPVSCQVKSEKRQG